MYGRRIGKIMAENILLNHNIPKVVIFTDASYDKDLKAGAWYCYIRIGDKKVKTGSIINSDIGNSTEAERVGVANSLWLANKMVDLTKHKIILYCDNLSAMKPVGYTNKTGTKRQRAKQQLVFYQKNIEPYLQKAMITDIRYIKGHATRSSRFKPKTRHLVHDLIDKEAKQILLTYRAECASIETV